MFVENKIKVGYKLVQNLFFVIAFNLHNMKNVCIVGRIPELQKITNVYDKCIASNYNENAKDKMEVILRVFCPFSDAYTRVLFAMLP